MYYNNKKLALSVFWVVVGVTLMALSVAEVLDAPQYAGMGGALTAVGVMQIIRNLRYRRDETYREKIDVEAKDERNGFLRMKSWSWAGYVAVLAEGVGAIVAMVMGERTVQLTLSYCVCGLIFTYWVAYLIVRKKY